MNNVLILVLTALLLCAAQESTIKLKKATFDIHTEPKVSLADLKSNEKLQLIIHFSHLSENIIQTAQQVLGVRISMDNYIPSNSFFVYGNALDLFRKAERIREIDWIGKMKSEYKTDLNLAIFKEKTNPFKSFDNFNLLVSFVEPCPTCLEKFKKDLQKLPAVFRQEGERVLVHVMDNYFAQDFLDYLTQQEIVQFVEMVTPKSKRNWSGTAILQGAQNYANQGNQFIRPIHAKGITGAGEIIGVGDTGLDFDGCFFGETTVPLETHDLTKSKVVGYFTVEFVSNGTTHRTDYKGMIINRLTLDKINGHGTHVAGSVAGKISHSNTTIVNKYQKYNGAAPDSRISVFDFEHPTIAGLQTPGDLYTGYYQVQYNGGARISTNSWGCSNPFQCTFDCTCTSEGQPVTNAQCRAQFGVDCCAFCNKYQSNARDTDKFMRERNDFISLIAAGNDGVMSRQYNIGDPSTSKNCIAVGSARAAFEDFNEAVLYENLSAELRNNNFTTIEQCCNAGNSECCPTIKQQNLANLRTSTPNAFNGQRLSSFSSRGPTYDNRVKPDIIAVGQLVTSANSDNDTSSKQCGDSNPTEDIRAAVYSTQGTSMATPTLAGGVALIRQYFREGYHVAGVKDTTKGINPSGTLLKAMAIHSAQPMVGGVLIDGTNLDPLTQVYPNNFTGFGLVQLNTALWFSDSTFKLSFFESNVTGADMRSFRCRLTGGNPFRATLTWNDLQSNTAVAASLINDIDLRVAQGATVLLGNGRTTPDRVNNVEQVRASSLVAGDVWVNVTGTSSNMLFQQFSLVITGDLGSCDEFIPFINTTTPRNTTTTNPPPINSTGTLTISTILLFSILFLTFLF